MRHATSVKQVEIPTTHASRRLAVLESLNVITKRKVDASRRGQKKTLSTRFVSPKQWRSYCRQEIDGAEVQMGESLCCGHQWRECGATAPARWHLIERYAPFESDSTGQIRGSRRQRPQGKAFVGRMAGWLATSAIRRPVCNKRLRHAKSPRPPFDPDIPHARFVLANVEQMVMGV